MFWGSEPIFAIGNGNQFIWMQDNAYPHSARIVNEYLQQKCYVHLHMNTIEYLWDNLEMC